MIYCFLMFGFLFIYLFFNNLYIMICLEKEFIHHDLGFLEGSIPLIALFYFIL